MTSTPLRQMTGVWRNQLGSLLTLHVLDSSLHGTYRSAVGDTCDAQPLTGACVARPDGSGVLGFVVRWPATGSLTTWTGRYDPAADRIVASWLLECGVPDDTSWRDTHLGHDEFQRDS